MYLEKFGYLMSRKKTIYKTRKEKVVKYYEYWKNDKGMEIQIDLNKLSIKKHNYYSILKAIEIEYDELKAILFRLNQIRCEIREYGQIQIRKREGKHIKYGKIKNKN